MTDREKQFLVLDIGSTSVRALIGQADENDRIDVLSVSEIARERSAMHAPIHQQDVVRAIKVAVGQASAQANLPLQDVWISIPSNWVTITQGKGEIALKRGEVRRGDLVAVLENARLPYMSPTRKVLHQCNLQVRVDGKEIAAPYIGAAGTRLHASTQLMMCSHQHVRYVTDTVKLAGLRPRGLLLETLAAASATLEAREMDEGALLVDLGARKTSIGYWVRGQVRDVTCLETGGVSFAEELAMSLRIPMATAIRLQETCSCVCQPYLAHEPPIELQIDQGEHRTVTPLAIAQILEPRVLELLAEIHAVARERGYQDQVRHMVLTGGGVWMQGFQRLAEGYPAFESYRIRLGLPRGIHRGGELVSQTRYATLVGLLKEAVADQSLQTFYPTEEQGVGVQMKKVVGKFIDRFF